MSLTVLAVDDEPPALDELVYLLRDDLRVGRVVGAPDALTALRLLEGSPVDAVFLDIRTDPTENVWPMVKAGKGISEMLLGSEDL